MARRQPGGRGGPQRHVKGFRPGKEPPQMRKRMAKEQFGELSPGQARMVEMFAERSPEEARGLIRRWQLGLLAVTIVLAVLAALLWAWSWIAGVIVGIIAVVVLFLWLRLRAQSAELEKVADAVSRGGRRGR